MKQLDEIVPIKLEYVFQISIDFSERVSFQTPNGRRSYVPAISGVVEGPRLQGIVVPHSGADYAGNGRLNAHYMLKASDGTMIYINNTGYLYPLDGKSTGTIPLGAAIANFIFALHLFLIRPSDRTIGSRELLSLALASVTRIPTTRSLSTMRCSSRWACGKSARIS